MKRSLFTAAILLAAVFLELYGLDLGATALFAAGGILEFWFWVRLRRATRTQASA